MDKSSLFLPLSGRSVDGVTRWARQVLPARPEDQEAEESTDDGPLWVIDEENSKEHWLEINDGEGWYAAVVKWDGCVHFYRYHNDPFGKRPTQPTDENEMVDYLHICDVDQMIEQLQAMKKIALKHFEGNWPG